MPMRPLRPILCLISALAIAACGASPASREREVQSASSTTPVTRGPSADDWARFGWDAGRSSATADETGITAANVGTMRRQQVTLDGTVDASPIYLHGVRMNGATHDVFFVTTTYGKTLAIDANDGSILWRFTPSGYESWAGSRRITNATPIADPNREFIYAASPDGRVEKIAIADGHAVWSTAITTLPEREKIASPLNYFRGKVIAVTGNVIWGRAGALIDWTTGDIFVATGNGRWDGRTNWGDAAIALDSSATNMIDNYTPTNTDELSARDADLGSTSP